LPGSQCEVFGSPPGVELRVMGAGQSFQAGLESIEMAGLESIEMAVEFAVAASGKFALVDEGTDGIRFCGHHAKHVQGSDVARALLDRMHGRVPQQPRQARLLAVSVTAEALERFSSVRGGPAAAPVLGYGDGQPAEGRVVLQDTCQAHGHCGTRLRLDSQVSEHIAHGRGLVERDAERPFGGGRGESQRPPRPASRGRQLARAGRD
jgi:hypothetical protein